MIFAFCRTFQFLVRGREPAPVKLLTLRRNPGAASEFARFPLLSEHVAKELALSGEGAYLQVTTVDIVTARCWRHTAFIEGCRLLKRVPNLAVSNVSQGRVFTS